MNSNLNSMPCSYVDLIDRLGFLENDKEASFMFKNVDQMPKEPLPNQCFSAMQETFAPFNSSVLCCYNVVVVLWMPMFVTNFVNTDLALHLVTIIILNGRFLGEVDRILLTI